MCLFAAGSFMAVTVVLAGYELMGTNVCTAIFVYFSRTINERTFFSRRS